ncbi:MAG: hypothetical protein ACLR2E_23915 [Lachnospiraceae bacterium]
MHALTIKTELLRKIPRIDEHCFYVDMEYVLFPIPYVRTVTFLEEVVYQYRIGLAGQSMDMKSMQKNEVNYTWFWTGCWPTTKNNSGERFPFTA